MSKTTTQKYRDFILENFIGDSLKVQLPKIDEKGRAWNVKLGLATYVKVDIEVIEKYSRSFKAVLKFNGFEVEQLFFTPLESSPPSIREKFSDKVSKIVVKAFIDDNRQEDLLRMHKEREIKIYNDIASAVKKMNTEEK